MKIYVKKVDGLVLPIRGTESSAAYDLQAISDPIIKGKVYTKDAQGIDLWERVDWVEYKTNFYTQPETLTHHMLCHPRSSNRKFNLILANSIGLIDNDYRNEWLCCFKYVWQPEDFVIIDGRILGRVNMESIYQKGEKIVQILAEATTQIQWVFVDELNQTGRKGGFGSTDKVEIQREVPKGKTLIEVFAESDHNIDVPSKNNYLNTIKERERNEGERSV